MVSHNNYNLGANEGFVIFLTSMLITCFIDGFTSKMKSQPIAYLLNESDHINWIVDLEDEVHSIWVICPSGLQECKGKIIVGRSGGSNFWSEPESFRFFLWGLPGNARSRPPPRPLSTKSGKKPNFFRPMHLVFGFNVKKTNFCK